MCYKIGLFIPTLSGGGAQRVALNLAQGFLATNCQVSLILVRAEGPLMEDIPPGVEVIDFNANRTLKSIPKLALHLRETQYDAVISFMNYVNVCAVIAKRLACSSCRLILTEHTIVSQSFQKKSTKERTIRRALMRLLYPLANHVVAVSQGVARDMEDFTGLSGVKFIPNPIVGNNKVLSTEGQALPHPWFAETHSVILGAGRLTELKDFSTLIRSLRQIRDRGRACRLVIIGEGEARDDLEALVRNLGLDDVVCLPGFVDNPYEFMQGADVLVLSSRWEGFGNVLVEAMACGTPVVSTDCPNGPREILEDGKWGCLVPVGDNKALAEAITKTLDAPPAPSDDLIDRARDFAPEKIAEQYLSLIENGAA